MNQLLALNNRGKKINQTCSLLDKKFSSEKLLPSKNIDFELQSKKSKNILVNDFTFEDLYKDNDSFQINIIQNPIELNFLEHIKVFL